MLSQLSFRYVLICSLAACSPLAALAEPPQRMAVICKRSFDIKAGQGADVPAVCVDPDRKEPEEKHNISASSGDVQVLEMQNGQAVSVHTLAEAVKKKFVVIKGTGDFDSIRINPGDDIGDKTYRVKFNGSTLFGTNAEDVKAGWGRIGVLEGLQKRGLSGLELQLELWDRLSK